MDIVLSGGEALRPISALVVNPELDLMHDCGVWDALSATCYVKTRIPCWLIHISILQTRPNWEKLKAVYRALWINISINILKYSNS